MKRDKKRGVSPAIATVLLISLGLVLAMIIFIWARSFISEKDEKFGEPVEDACKNVDFNAEVELSASKVKVNNIGNVPIYAVELRLKEDGKIKKVGSGEFNGVPVGGHSSSVDITDADLTDVDVGDDLIAVPIILGETDERTKPHTCDEKYGRPVEIF